ncbi:hypothetical protein Glove_248g19 [Diversispora epigaea]|uniref:BED-type domain-containing protein n=1 Tax=Diversispora epigaea TaxID=1348612 RepID=A0A397IAY7_9GLOM|nr:hypothetical protein Glove_248g19 [Diversispora epigaea]
MSNIKVEALNIFCKIRKIHVKVIIQNIKTFRLYQNVCHIKGELELCQIQKNNYSDIKNTKDKVHIIKKQLRPSYSQEIEFNNSHAKSKVWNYFTKPYGPPKSRKTKCHECGNEFLYHDSPSSLKYHLKNIHKIDLSNNLKGFFTVLDKLLKINKNDKGNNDALIIQGKFYQKMGEYEESIGDCNRALEIEPNNVEEKIYSRIYKYEESITDLSGVIEIEPNNVDALISRGDDYIEIDLSRAIEIESNNVNALKKKETCITKWANMKNLLQI